MSRTKVKTTYSIQGSYGSTEIKNLYCEHNHSSDYVKFYNEDGSVVEMCFNEWETGDDLWDAMNRLWHPFKGDWSRSELIDKVEFYIKEPWKQILKKEYKSPPAPPKDREIHISGKSKHKK